jgi:rSAM/selenodomain-associated transferase 1
VTTAFVIMAKAPQPGAVKTRLVPPLSAETAAALSACFIRDMAALVDRTIRGRAAYGYVGYAPIGAEADFEGLLPAGFGLVPQGDGDLTTRLITITQGMFETGIGALCLMNSDSPSLPNSALATALDALERPGDRVVLGPAEDGGYYLIGVKAPHMGLFRDIAWSTDVVLRQTLDRARQLGLSVELLEPWYDVDTGPELSRLRTELAAAPSRAPATAVFLRSLDL